MALKQREVRAETMELYFRAFQRFRKRIDSVSIEVFSKRDIKFLIHQSLLRTLDEVLGEVSDARST